MFTAPRSVQSLLKASACSLYVLAFCSGFLASPASALAYEPRTYSGPEQSIKDFLCTPTAQPSNQGTGDAGYNGATVNNSASNDLYSCINKVYRMAIVVASVVGMGYVVAAGYLYLSADGSSEQTTKAKGYIGSVIAALIILFSGNILLKAINPNLVNFYTIQPPAAFAPRLPDIVEIPVTGVQTPPRTTTPAGPGSQSSAQAAQRILSQVSAGKIVLATAHPSGIADNANARQNVADQAAGKQASNSCYTNSGVTAPCKTVDLNTKMLDSIATAADVGKFTVSEIAGAVHSANMQDSHYIGRGVDIVPSNPTAELQSKLVQSFRSGGATQIGLECVGGPNKGFLILTGTNDADASCIGKPNYHLHVQW